MQLLDHALAYYDHGWQVMPCQNKQPLLDTWEGLQDLRIPRETITDWWTRWPDAQIALICGEISGVTAIDIDWIKDKDHNILAHLSLNPDDIGKTIPNSPQSFSGSRGKHVLVKYEPVKNSTKAVHSQIDIKSDGGYIILPPSRYDETRSYEWDTRYPLWSSKLTTMPETLRKACQEREKEKTNWEKLASGAEPGERNIITARMIGKIIRMFREEEANAAWKLTVAYNKLNRPPLPEHELLSTFKSIAKREYARRKTNSRS